jgi:hypothetical protein
MTGATYTLSETSKHGTCQLAPIVYLEKTGCQNYKTRQAAGIKILN